MKRKIVQQGPSTLMVSLPFRWVKEKGLSKGDELELHEVPQGLMLSADTLPKESIVSYDVTGFSRRAVKWLIHIAYKRGIDNIDVVSDSEETAEFVRGDLLLSPGLDVEEQTDRRIMLKNIAKGLDMDFENLLRKDFLNTMELLRLIGVKLTKNDLASMRQLKRFYDFNDKTSVMGGRIVNIELGRSHQSVFYYLVFWYHEKIMDRIKYATDYLADHPDTKISKEGRDLFEGIADMFRSYYELFYKFEIRGVEEMIRKQSKIKTSGYKALTEMSGNQTVFIHHLVEVSEMILECLPITLAVNLKNYELTK